MQPFIHRKERQNLHAYSNILYKTVHTQKERERERERERSLALSPDPPSISMLYTVCKIETLRELGNEA